MCFLYKGTVIVAFINKHYTDFDRKCNVHREFGSTMRYILYPVDIKSNIKTCKPNQTSSLSRLYYAYASVDKTSRMGLFVVRTEDEGLHYCIAILSFKGY